MTVKELRDELNKLIEDGAGDMPVQISFYEKDDGYCGGDVYYDIRGAMQFGSIVELDKSGA